MTININMAMNTIYQLGFVSLDLPNFVVQPIKKEIDDILDKKFENTEKYNIFLAGAIEHEYRLVDSCDEFEKFINHMMPSYYEMTNAPDHIRNKKVKLNDEFDFPKKDFWVNFQRKNEYNPLHYHSGFLSFVIWIKIPYNREDEINLPNIKNSIGKGRIHSSLVFRYPVSSDWGGIGSYTLELDKTHENKMIIFPAHLMHEVTPFYTSDDYRISVSGNLVFAE